MILRVCSRLRTKVQPLRRRLTLNNLRYKLLNKSLGTKTHMKIGMLVHESKKEKCLTNCSQHLPAWFSFAAQKQIQNQILCWWRNCRKLKIYRSWRVDYQNSKMGTWSLPNFKMKIRQLSWWYITVWFQVTKAFGQEAALKNEEVWWGCINGCELWRMSRAKEYEHSWVLRLLSRISN